MLKFTIKRLLMLIPIMLGVLVIVFCIRAITPGNPAAMQLPDTATEEEIAAKEAELGLDQP